MASAWTASKDAPNVCTKVDAHEGDCLFEKLPGLERALKGLCLKREGDRSDIVSLNVLERFTWADEVRERPNSFDDFTWFAYDCPPQEGCEKKCSPKVELRKNRFKLLVAWVDHSVCKEAKDG